MENAALKTTIQSDLTQAMRAGDADRRDVLRFLMAAIKQKEVDNKQKFGESGLPDEQIIIVVEKLCKQRRESIEQYTQAGRQDLADAEAFQLSVMQTYLPEPLSEAELHTLIAEAISQTHASTMKDMGAVMAQIKPLIQGRADPKWVSTQIKDKLAAK